MGSVEEYILWRVGNVIGSCLRLCGELFWMVARRSCVWGGGHNKHIPRAVMFVYASCWMFQNSLCQGSCVKCVCVFQHLVDKMSVYICGCLRVSGYRTLLHKSSPRRSFTNHSWEVTTTTRSLLPYWAKTDGHARYMVLWLNGSWLVDRINWFDVSGNFKPLWEAVTNSSAWISSPTMFSSLNMIRETSIAIPR